MTVSTRLQLIFVLLQLGDVVTTILVFALGGYEANPLVSRMIHVGTLQGLIFAKVLALAVATAIVWRGNFRILRAANDVYSAIVAWNSFLIVVTVLGHAVRR